MVQLKYFGDSRDFFKYDLIRAILSNKDLSLSHYVFVPMLTEHRNDNEGRILPRNRNDSSCDLLKFITDCDSKSLTHWERFLKRYAKYKTLTPVDENFFSDGTRSEYWRAFQPIIKQINALVFVDPDTGLETGKPWYLKKMGLEKYILNDELKSLINEIDASSALMLYQHLPRNKSKHNESVTKKLEQVHHANTSAFVCAYREDDLAFLFVTKKEKLHKKIYTLLCKYHKDSNHDYKSIHVLSNQTKPHPLG
jgi:hypothetical protein